MSKLPKWLDTMPVGINLFAHANNRSSQGHEKDRKDSASGLGLRDVSKLSPELPGWNRIAMYSRHFI